MTENNQKRRLIVIKIDGLMARKHTYPELISNLMFQVSQIEGLGVTQDQIDVYAMPNIIQKNPESKVFVFVEGIFEKKVVTSGTRQELIETILNAILVFVRAKNLRVVKHIKIFPNIIDSVENGYCSEEVKWD